MKTIQYMGKVEAPRIIERGLLPCNQGQVLDEALPSSMMVTPENQHVEVTVVEAAYLLGLSTYDKHGNYVEGPWRAVQAATPPPVEAVEPDGPTEDAHKAKRKR